MSADSPLTFQIAQWAQDYFTFSRAIRELAEEGYSQTLIEAMTYCAFIQDRYGHFNSNNFKVAEKDAIHRWKSEHWKLLVQNDMVERWAYGKYRLSKRAIRILWRLNNKLS